MTTAALRDWPAQLNSTTN